MKRKVPGIALYRFRATFSRRWSGYLSVVILVGLLGGTAMASIAAGRRTQSSYPIFLASTNPSDMSVSMFGGSSSQTAADPYSATVTRQITHLAHVKRVESIVQVNVVPLEKNGAPFAGFLGQLASTGSVDGLFFNQDRVTVLHGRMADPKRVDEVVMSAEAARVLGRHVGQVIPMGEYTPAQINSPAFGTPSVPPHRRFDVTLVGIVVLNNQVVQDDADRFPAFVVFTPATTRHLLAESGTTIRALQLDHGSRDVAAVEQELLRHIRPGYTDSFHVTARIEARVERAVKPEAIALGVFGGIAALATLLTALQVMSRLLQSENEDRLVLRALGAGPIATASDGLIGILGAVVVGSLMAAGISVVLSPLAPLGPTRPVYPSPGIAFDWTVLGLGLLVLIGGLGTIAVALSYSGAPHRVAGSFRENRRSSLVEMATSSGLSPAAVVGVRSALETGRGRTAVPVRSALIGGACAVTMVVATLTFGNSLQTLVSHPALYGWNWSYALNPSNVVPPKAVNLLNHDPLIAAWTGAVTDNALIDGQNVPILLGNPQAAISPPILSGHAMVANSQIVLGTATMTMLHKHIGDTVVFTYGTPQQAPAYIPSKRLVIVGTATMPAIGFPSFIADHTSMGTGALVSIGIETAAFRQALLSPDPNQNGPALVFVRLREGVSPTAGHADIQRIADVANKVLAADPAAAGNNVAVLGVQRPAEIVNYRSIGAIPVILACGLAAGATIALGLTLAASVRRRRHDFALLKTLGFTQRQLAAAVAWQASVAAALGIVVGVPFGFALGRQLWVLFAHNIDAVPKPTVPTSSVILVALGAIVFANVVAAFPGRRAARTPTALVLRTE